MENNQLGHTFHIPVMGIGYTIDTPLKVAHYGISSVISLVDDILIEKMRAFYCRKFEMPFKAIASHSEDHRAKRITAYLDLVDTIARQKFCALKNSILEKGSELEKYISMLPEVSLLKQKSYEAIQGAKNSKAILQWIQDHLSMGSIDVNIMTKLDRENYRDHEKLPAKFNDAHAALRGFAKSKLRSSVILSAGMNPRLYSYLEEFEDFYPDENGRFKKKIMLKVSDYRSALVQGKYLAKKGLWVSEYRIESGLNCGGHAFATDGHLMGPILEEFKQNRATLIQATRDLLVAALKAKRRWLPDPDLGIKISAQGGVGTAAEHQFLIDHYHLDSVGWGTPFLLVPEVTSVDGNTIELLKDAREKDLYTSNTSPLGVPFNTLRGNTKDLEKALRIEAGKPGSPCPKKFASNNREFTSKQICTASQQYQHLKIKELKTKDLPAEKYEKEYKRITEKSCICVGLGTSILLANQLDTTEEGKGVSICPGPNLAYFSQTISLRRMVGHIYGRNNILSREDRPHVFINELRLYVDHFRNMLAEEEPRDSRQRKYTQSFQNNLNQGISYYRDLYSNNDLTLGQSKTRILHDLENLELMLDDIDLVEA